MDLIAREQTLFWIVLLPIDSQFPKAEADEVIRRSTFLRGWTVPNFFPLKASFARK